MALELHVPVKVSTGADAGVRDTKMIVEGVVNRYATKFTNG